MKLSNREVFQITNIQKFENYSGSLEINDIINTILKLNLKKNKNIHPNIFAILKKNGKFKVDFIKSAFIFNKKKYDCSYQLLCVYYIIRYLRKNLKNNKELCNYFFQKHEIYGLITKNIKVEVDKDKKHFFDDNYRIDMIITLPNNEEILIEINELYHEKNDMKRNDVVRARQLIDVEPNIIKILAFRERYIENNKKNIKKIVNKILIPLINERILIHNKKKFFTDRLIKCLPKQLQDIAILIYDSWNDKYIPITLIDILNKLHGVNFTCCFIDTVDELIKCQDNGKADNEYKKLSNCTDNNDILLSNNDLSSSESDSDNELSNTNKKESKEDYYSIINNKLFLTWKGFNAYHSHVIKKMTIPQSKPITDFTHNIKDQFMEILNKFWILTLKIYKNPKLWGFDKRDYIEMGF